MWAYNANGYFAGIAYRRSEIDHGKEAKGWTTNALNDAELALKYAFFKGY